MTECAPSTAIDDAFTRLTYAASDSSAVKGWTHNFYRYPARFSPTFAATAIAELSNRRDLIIDPYMGGGTVVVEGLVAGREVVGNDLNSLAVFVCRVKTTTLSTSELCSLRKWILSVPKLSYTAPREPIAQYYDVSKSRNLNLVRSRFIKKVIAAALASIDELPSQKTQDFAKCAVLRVTQLALDGRARHTPLFEFRSSLERLALQMVNSIEMLGKRVGNRSGRVQLLNHDAKELPQSVPFASRSKRKALVITSPPYPGVHVLYHRWQVDGRKESPAPYWISGCNDGQGAAFYNFGDRRQGSADNYFAKSLETLHAIRELLRKGSVMVQLVAFNNPDNQLPRYLTNMNRAGFEELTVRNDDRLWRDVPNRKWHATLQGQTNSARELLMIHRAR